LGLFFSGEREGESFERRDRERERESEKERAKQQQQTPKNTKKETIIRKDDQFLSMPTKRALEQPCGARAQPGRKEKV